MNTKQIKFKNVGKFLDESSSRYEATIDSFIVRVWKCSYLNCWKYSFYTLTGYGLDEMNCDFLSNLHSNATKSDCYQIVNEIIADIELKNQINERAKKIEERMKEFNLK